MKFLLSCNYVLREDAKDSYLLYNKCDLIAYHITYKLYVFLSLFRKNATDIDAVFEGRSFYSSVSYCRHMSNIK